MQTELIVNFINGYLGVFDWILANVFFFVTPNLLKLFALSFFIMSIMQIFQFRGRWIKWTIAILYGLYCLLKIFPIRNFLITFDLSQLPTVIPYFCMLLLPMMMSKTALGAILLTYQTMTVYYIIINVVWISVDVTAGLLYITLGYAAILFILAQFGGKSQ